MKHARWQPRRTPLLFFITAVGALCLGAYLVATEQPRPVYHHVVDRSLLYLHIIGAAIAIMLGPLLMLDRSRRPAVRALHRWFGRCYAVSIALASSSGFAIARLYEPGGWVARLGIAAAAATWGVVTMIAWWQIRQRQIAAHREWMVRSFAVTLAFLSHQAWVVAVTYSVVALGQNEQSGAALGNWLFWTSNLLIAEGIIRVMRMRKQPVPLHTMPKPVSLPDR